MKVSVRAHFMQIANINLIQGHVLVIVTVLWVVPMTVVAIEIVVDSVVALVARPHDQNL